MTPRRLTIPLLLAVSASLAAALPVSGARASVESAPRVHKFFGGVIPDGRRTGGARARAAAAALPYQGGPVLHANRTFLIFWQPAGSGLTFDAGYMPLMERFLLDVAAGSHTTTNVYGLSGQYHDAGGPAAYVSRYGGAVLDTQPLPSSGCVEPPLTGPGWADCLNDTQYEGEIIRVIHADHLPTGPSDVYFMVTPQGLGSCEGSGPDNCALGGSASGSYCGYHSATPDTEVLYALIPYNAVPGHCQSGSPRPNANTADPAISTLSHEHNEIVTDPLGNGWVDSQGNEDGDLCITDFGPQIGGSGATAWNERIKGDPYYLQEEYSNLDGGCRPRARPDTASFTARATSRGTALVGRGSAPGVGIASYQWFFSDGRTAAGRSITHRFTRAGRYLVGLRITDRSANYAYVTSWVTVRHVVARRVASRR